MEFRKVPCFNIENAPTTRTHVDFDLTNNEIEFELQDKEHLLDKLFRREINNEDDHVAHLRFT